MNSIRGEIATKLTIIALLVLTLGIFAGSNASRMGSTTTYAASNCAYAFDTPILSVQNGKLICSVPTSSEDITTVSCSVAQNDSWSANSKLIDSDGSTMRFELTLYDGKGPGTYDLIAYEFDPSCIHEDRGSQVVIRADMLAPAPTNIPTPTPTPEATPTPTIVPVCMAENLGNCMSQALCLAGVSNQDLGDLGCSELRRDWVCCAVPGSVPTTPTPTDIPLPTITIAPTATTVPTTPPASTARASANVSVTKTESCIKEVKIASSNRQSWAYRVGANGLFEVVPVLGSTDKQQVVDAVCE